MKKNLILLLAVIVLAGCETSNRVPYTGMGEYGFTFDLDNSPSPFRDTSYRPLTVRDLSRPIVVTPTNQVTLNLAGPDFVTPAPKPAVAPVIEVLPTPPPVVPAPANPNP